MALPPLVGLPTDRKQIGLHPFLAAGEKYVRAVVDGAGATPVLLPALQPPLAADEWLPRLDGLLLTGAVSNIEPHHYGDEPSYEGNLHDPARDATTLGLVPRAVAMGGRELLGEDSDKDQVIDTQHQFDNHQRDETCPD